MSLKSPFVNYKSKIRLNLDVNKSPKIVDLSLVLLILRVPSQRSKPGSQQY